MGIFSRRTLPIATYPVALLCLLLNACTKFEVEQGDLLAEEGNWDGAVAMYKQALREDPFNDELEKKFEEAKEHGAHAHYLKGQERLKANNIPEALQEFQLAMTLDPYKAEHQAALLDAQRLKEANQKLTDGKKLQSLGRLDEALSHYERAIELNPDLAEALAKITAIAQYQRAYQAMGQTTEPVTMRFQNTRLKQVFEILARTANIDILFDKDIRDDLVTIFTRDTPFPEALNLILTTNQLFAKRVAPETLLIIPDTKQKHEQYQDLKIRTFYLSNAKAKDMANLLRTILETKRVYVNETLNTVVVRDNPAKVTLAEHIILANDRADSEVLLDVEVLEVTRNKDEKYGIDYAKQIGVGVFPPGSDGFSSPLAATVQQFSFQQLANLGSSSYLISFPSNAVIDFSKQLSDAKTLASPKLRVRNGEKASINVGDKQPILLSTTNVLPGQASTGVTPTTSTVTSVEYKDTGIKVTVEPTIHLDNSVSLKMQVEVITLGDRVVLQTDPEISQFRFGQRTADTALIVKDGETVVLGGLIQEQDRKTRESIAWLDDAIPWLGSLLSSVQVTKMTTEIIIIITPHVVREITPAEVAKRSLWSGTAKKFSVDPLFTKKETPMTLVSEHGTLSGPNGSAIPKVEVPEPDFAPKPAPVVPPASSQEPQATPETHARATPQSQSEIAAQLAFTPASLSKKVGEEFRVDLTGQDIPSIEKSRVTISYDPKIVQFTQALEGTFWKQNNVPPSLSVSAVPQKGQVVIQMGRKGQSAKGSGQLVTLIFEAKAAGNARLEIQRPSFLRSDKKPVPVITQHGRISIQ